MEGDVSRKVWPSEGLMCTPISKARGPFPLWSLCSSLSFFVVSVYSWEGRRLWVACWVDSTPPASGNLYPSSVGVMEAFLSPYPSPLPHPLVCCNAAEVQGSFFIHRPECTVKGGGAGEGSNGASLGKVTLFPLVLNR